MKRPEAKANPTPSQPATRRRRFSQPLKPTGVAVKIPSRWEELPMLPTGAHESVFVEILNKHRLSAHSPVPLVGRYSKARRWSAEELAACLVAHDKGIPVALMSAALNRNPQDIIFRLLDERHGKAGGFKEVGLKTSRRWTPELLAAGRELFEAGLTAWRVAALFGLDFEGAEKLLYAGREDYGHTKKNPFAICTDHKQVVNKALVGRIAKLHDALDAFAGEGRFARILTEAHPKAELLCVEQDPVTFSTAQTACAWSPRVTWRQGDNLPVMEELVQAGATFDLIDLDPFASCREQIEPVWNLLRDQAALFITFGGEYRRSFIGTNRGAIHRRYGWSNTTLSNSDYLEVVPAYFFGWVANQAARHGFVLNLDYGVRYPNNCRFWTTVKKVSKRTAMKWLRENVVEHESGFLWRNLVLPRFAEVRYKTHEIQGQDPPPSAGTQRSRVRPKNKE